MHWIILNNKVRLGRDMTQTPHQKVILANQTNAITTSDSDLYIFLYILES